MNKYDFFNGEFDLLRQEKSYSWLSQESLNDYKINQLRYRPANDEEFDSLEEDFQEIQSNEMLNQAKQSLHKRGLFTPTHRAEVDLQNPFRNSNKPE